MEPPNPFTTIQRRNSDSSFSSTDTTNQDNENRTSYYPEHRDTTRNGAETGTRTSPGTGLNATAGTAPALHLLPIPESSGRWGQPRQPIAPRAGFAAEVPTQRYTRGETSRDSRRPESRFPPPEGTFRPNGLGRRFRTHRKNAIRIIAGSDETDRLWCGSPRMSGRELRSGTVVPNLFEGGVVRTIPNTPNGDGDQMDVNHPVGECGENAATQIQSDAQRQDAQLQQHDNGEGYDGSESPVVQMNIEDDEWVRGEIARIEAEKQKSQLRMKLLALQCMLRSAVRNGRMAKYQEAKAKPKS